MAAKRKQEEKHLKLLRDMTTLQHNRKCFDCDQRGPTYVNMTIGSFVCTSCSGILRGLNPPHRVKSISMTTFTQQEIEFLQKHGNEVCKQIWLGLYDERSSIYPDFRDPQKVKDFLQEKYEKKRWFVPAERAWAVAAAHASISGSSASSASSTPEVKPGKSLLYETTHLNKGTPTQSPAVSRSQGSQQEKKVAPFDLLTDLGGDIFAAPQSAPPYFTNFTHFNSHTAPTPMNVDFANFAFGSCNTSDNFGGFSSASLPPFQSNSTVFRALSSGSSFGDFASAFPLPASHSGSAASTNANFANFDNFPKSSSADFGAFCSSGNDTAINKAHAVTQDKYAALADLDNVFSNSTSTQGGSSQLTSFSSTTVGSSVMSANQSNSSANKYAALAELDNVFSSPSTTSNVSSTSSVFGTVQSATAVQTHPGASAIPAAFGATNPFVAAPVLPAPATNPFQTNGRTAVSFGTASMSMPTLFASPAGYTLPTSFSGGFQQPVLSGPVTFPQHSAFPQQPVGGGFGSFGQPKPMVMPYGQPMAASTVSSNPFLAGAPMGQFPTGSSSTNPFL
ncbi:arf-GAP domain and FG repeat-containing protein 1a isoform X2 [Chiloscyllium plagiosum]|uniref:arf-GAP domain and FG repeat-containing protein 1a isoform X2 n=1 Tax=Chiloscyllium plagiosum TaxID=36176 RepID=UPI001CB86A50|nr:arf-GAP domain and FG repeat-containing protein 1a isoform X2 [Chiloscyllium plagiosum]